MGTGPKVEARSCTIEHYELTIPPGYALKNLSREASDFEFFSIYAADDQEREMSLYVGLNPAFPKYHWSAAALKETKEDGVAREEYGYAPGSRMMEGLLTFKGLTYQDWSRSPFRYIHYFARDIGADTAKAFASIVRSIKVVKPHVE
jgi:hypothetical protein